MTYDDTNRGVLFKNKDKQGDTHPDYKGEINFDGTNCFLSAWLKTSKNGEKYMSLSVKPKGNAVPMKSRAPEPQVEFDDALPF